MGNRFRCSLCGRICGLRRLPDHVRLVDGQTADALHLVVLRPRYIDTLVNTLLFVCIGVNVKMFLAFLVSGFFMQGFFMKRITRIWNF